MAQNLIAPAPVHDVIADRVKNLRKARGWSAQRLADEMTRVDVPWDRSIVANFENRRRTTLSVEEMLALAYVLDVAPVHLLVPPVAGDDDGPYWRIVPTIAPTLAAARAWIAGREAVAGQDPRVFFSEVPPGSNVEPSDLEVAMESARIQYHRRNGHLLRAGTISHDEYWSGVTEAVNAARRALDSGDDAR